MERPSSSDLTPSSMTSTAGNGPLPTGKRNAHLIEDTAEFRKLLDSKAKDLFVKNASEVSLEYLPCSKSPGMFSSKHYYAYHHPLLT